MGATLEQVRLATATIVDADATLQGLMGRATDLIREPASMDQYRLPLLVFTLSVDAAVDRGELELLALSDDGATPATAACTGMLAAAAAALNAVAFAAAGVDVIPLDPFSRLPSPDDDMLGMLDLITPSPTLRAARMTIPLLVFT